MARASTYKESPVGMRASSSLSVSSNESPLTGKKTPPGPPRPKPKPKPRRTQTSDPRTSGSDKPSAEKQPDGEKAVEAKEVTGSMEVKGGAEGKDLLAESQGVVPGTREGENKEKKEEQGEKDTSTVAGECMCRQKCCTYYPEFK